MKFGDGIDWDNHVDEILLGSKPIRHSERNPTKRTILLKKYVKQGSKIIDCGCHIGRYSNFLCDLGYKYTGVDQSEKALAVAKLVNPRGKYIHSFLWDLELDEKFDVAWFSAVLQHNTLEEKEKIIPRIYNSLKPGGYVFIAESTEPKKTKTQLTYIGWIKLFEKFGFRFIESWHKNPKGLDDNYIFRKPLK